MDALGEVIRQEARQVVLRELAKLDDSYRQVVLLKVIQGMTLREVAEVVGVSLSTVNHRLNEGLGILARRLGNLLGAKFVPIEFKAEGKKFSLRIPQIADMEIEALAGDWDPEKYHDNFQENLKKLIETKLEGGEIQEVEKPKKMAPVIDLMAALKESLAQSKKPAASERESAAPAAKRGRR